MPIVIGISLRTAGKIYYFDPGTDSYHRGEQVLVETARGQELGVVKLPPFEVRDEEIVAPLKTILRRATALDTNRESLNRDREEQALRICKGLVEKLNLPMRLIDAQYTLDGSHVLVHFIAENRVDFRELVRELARELRTRIELRQVGVRDEAKLLGGYGMCGRKLCCSAFLTDFSPVAISMAKDQGLALNPQKISGSCGRLMCCLAFERDHYRNERADMPRINATVETPQGVGKVTKLNVLARLVEVMIPDVSAPCWFSLDELAGKLPAKSCCGSKKEPGACGGCHTSTEPGDSVFYDVDEVTLTTTETTIARDNPATSEERPSRPRRRRRKPAVKPDGAHPQAMPVEQKSASGTTPPISPEKPKRRRRRKPRTTALDGASAASISASTEG